MFGSLVTAMFIPPFLLATISTEIAANKRASRGKIGRF
ncbi:hypothetical protein QY96_01566 [Bacillus thermotolerans]|nr:hypothetical protein QY96_01566 [Bacillus thermotolerans]